MANEVEQLRNLTINGTSHVGGGAFDKVVIRGEAFIDDNLVCNLFKIMGTVHVRGQLQAKRVQIMGKAEMDGNIRTEELKVMGELTVRGDCSAELFQANGAFFIDGLLNGENIKITLHGPAKAKEIGAASVEVKPHLKRWAGSNRMLTAEVIEGDEICLIRTKADVVRGNRVEIGSGCDVDLVEYKTSFNPDKTARIGQVHQS